MVKSSWKRVTYFKSPLRVVINFLSKSRDLKADKYRELKQEFDQSCVELNRVQKRVLECEDELCEWKARYYRLESNRYREAQATPITLPADPPVGRHGYGARMIVLCLMLVRVIGFRSTAKVLQIVFQWLGVKQKIPHFTTMIGWMKRWGVSVQQESLEKADDWIWKVDHSNQIGQEKVLVVLGVRASKLSAEATLRHEDLHVLAVRPSKDCKREDVAAVYKDLAKTYGAPRELISDKAVELQESAECLKALREDIVILQDFKHKAANLLEAAVGKSQEFASFLTHVGTTRSAIQQTELAHLTPPVLKSKARFMNLGALLTWGMMVLWLLRTPDAKSRQGMTTERFTSKLGWLAQFQQELEAWDECQQVINRGLDFINSKKLFRGAADQMRQAMGENLQHAVSRQLADRLTEFVRGAEASLKEGERLSLSTEILESSFARYKQLEGQHCKGGFTTLIATFAGLLKPPTPELIKVAFKKVSAKDVHKWLEDNMKTTVTSKRRSTYIEMRKATGRYQKPTKKSATKVTTIA